MNPSPIAPACALCGAENPVPLPLPHPAQSMLSDGRIWPAPLAKTLCRQCGSIAHVAPPDAENVRQFYDADYDLGVEPSAQDTSRNQAYTDFIKARAGAVRPARVLEIGCGSGQTLAGLAEVWPEARFLGLEAAEQLAARDSSDRIEIAQGFIEDLAPPTQPFDLVFAINVVEHAADPMAFVAAAAGQLTSDGRIVLVCPAAEPPNLELVFQDHVHSFTHAAFRRIAAASRLEIIESVCNPAGLAGFQVFVLGRSTAAQSPPSAGERDRAERIAAYLDAWQRLDDVLADRTADAETIDLFGAGEMAALLRCYAPHTWERVRYLLVDDLAGARALGREIHLLSDTPPPGATIVATHPRSQSALATRLRQSGHRTVVFNDLIAR